MKTWDYRHWILTHLIWVAGLGTALFLGHILILEHDRRLLADQQVKASEASVKTLQEQIEATRASAAKQHADVLALVKSVKTPAQAIQAIPTLTDVPLNTRPGPDPMSVTVDATALFNGLAVCKQDKIDAAACSQVSAKQDEQIKEKDKEIAVLKRKPRFWARLKGILKTAAVTVGVVEGLRIAGGRP